MEHFEKFKSYIPFDLMEPKYFLMACAVLFGILVFRYFLMAGAFWFVFYRMKPAGLMQRQIYQNLPAAKIQFYEIKWSILTGIPFTLGALAIGIMWQRGWTQIYLPFNQYGLWYLIPSLLILSLVHDFYFYATHRFLHTTWAYRRFHSVHHNSLTPSPWASFSFHPVEALIQAAAIPLLILFIPLHPVMILIYLTFMTLSGITNHLGFEILPQGSEKGFGKWLVSGVHHTQHHRYYRYNYGLFYTFWDRIFKTEHPKFPEEFRQVFEKKSV